MANPDINNTIQFVDGLFVLVLTVGYEDKLQIFVLPMENADHIEHLLNLNRQLTAIEKDEIKAVLTLYVNHLLLSDFNKLVQILYRVDVSEKKLKELLQANPHTDAAIIIAELLIQRQEEKIKTKETFKPKNNIAEEDKW